MQSSLCQLRLPGAVAKSLKRKRADPSSQGPRSYVVHAVAPREAHVSYAQSAAGSEPAISRRALLAAVACTGLCLNQSGAAEALEQRATTNNSATVLPKQQATQTEGVTSLLGPQDVNKFSQNQRQVLEINKRVQRQNNSPNGFPNFVRQGFDLKVVADGYTKHPHGFIYRDFQEGAGDRPQDGQEVTFSYVAYNESGAKIDSSYQKGRPASTRLGINGLIPGFEMGIKDMKVGGQRRIIVPPELGPPTGPSTFFSAKQCEVFDVELQQVKSCQRKQAGMFSTVTCQ